MTHTTSVSAYGPDDGEPEGAEDPAGSAGSRERGWSDNEAPDNEVPVTLAVDQVIGVGEDVVVYVAAMGVFSRGAEFTVEVRARPSWPAGQTREIWDGVHGHGRSADRLLLGVEYADGRRCSNIGGPFGTGDGVYLRPSGSSGGGRTASAHWYLSPLPPPGELRIYCAWPSADVAETVTVIDADRLIEAAGRVRELWPWEPERHEGHEPVRPTIPEGGWFAALADAEER